MWTRGLGAILYWANSNLKADWGFRRDGKNNKYSTVDIDDAIPELFILFLELEMINACKGAVSLLDTCEELFPEF